VRKAKRMSDDKQRKRFCAVCKENLVKTNGEELDRIEAWAAKEGITTNCKDRTHLHIHCPNGHLFVCSPTELP
jgi:hypothetical protein